MSGVEHKSFAVGDWLVEPGLNRISTGTQSVYLRRQLMDVLVHLADLQGATATLESMHDALWRGRVVSSGTIYNCIADLRRALARDGRRTEYIETIPKVGYRLAMPVTARPGRPVGSNEASSVAVLPLVNRSGDPQLEYLCDGIVDEVLQRLKEVDGVRVYSAFTLKGQQLDPRVVGMRFEARTVLTGSLQRAGDRLRLTFRLDDVETGESLWSDRFDQDLSDIFAVQEETAREVARALRPRMGVPEIPGKVGTQRFDALNAFLLGKHAVAGMTATGFDEAIRFFEQATSFDPDFAHAHYRLYLACHLRNRYYGEDPVLLDKARKAAAAARNLGFRPPVPWIHIWRRVGLEPLPATRELGLEAIDRIAGGDPEWSSFGYEQLAWVLSASGFFRTTLAFACRAFDSPSSNAGDSDADEDVPEYCAAAGDYADAIRRWSGIIQRDPLRPVYRYRRAVLYARTGQLSYARQDLESLDAEPFRVLGSALYDYWSGRRERLGEYHERLLAMPDIHPAYLLLTATLTGDLDLATRCCVEAANSRPRSFIDLGPLRVLIRARFPKAMSDMLEQHSRFQGLLAEHGITEAWRRELMERLNAISHLTGIAVAADG